MKTKLKRLGRGDYLLSQKRYQNSFYFTIKRIDYDWIVTTVDVEKNPREKRTRCTSFKEARELASCWFDQRTEKFDTNGY